MLTCFVKVPKADENQTSFLASPSPPSCRCWALLDIAISGRRTSKGCADRAPRTLQLPGPLPLEPQWPRASSPGEAPWSRYGLG